MYYFCVADYLYKSIVLLRVAKDVHPYKKRAVKTCVFTALLAILFDLLLQIAKQVGMEKFFDRYIQTVADFFDG